MLDLAVGEPGEGLRKMEMITDALQKSLSGAPQEVLNYTRRFGIQPFCAAAALASNLPASAEARICATLGASHGLELAARHAVRPRGGAVIVEAPTYHLTHAVFRDHLLEIVPIHADDAAGMDPAAVAAEIDARAGGPAARRIGGVYIVAAWANPRGVAYPRERAAELVRVCRERGVVVLADEAYCVHTFAPDATAPPHFHELDPVDGAGGGDTVVGIYTMSKWISAPALRCGWLVAPPWLMASLEKDGVLISGGTCGVTQMAAAAMLRDGTAEAYVRDCLRPGLLERCTALCDALAAELPPTCRFIRPQGGYFVWLNTGVPAVKVAAAAEAAGVKVAAGPKFGGGAEYVRLCFATLLPWELREAAKRLGALIRTLAAEEH